MESIKNIFKIGKGPSSSHTMGPRNAAIQFKERNPNAVKYNVTLYGSLAATGVGHLTDVAIIEVLGNETCNITWLPHTFLPQHPTGMFFEAFNYNGYVLVKWPVFSIGCGDVS